MLRIIGFLLFLGCWGFAPAFQNPPAAPETQALKQAIQNAQAEYKQGNFSGAARHFQQAVRLAPNNGRLHLVLGLSLLKAESFAESHPVLLRAGELLPGDIEPLLVLIQVEIAMRKLDLAGQHAARAAEINPEDIRLALLRVQIDALSGDVLRLQATIRSIARQFPNESRLHAEIGHWLFAQRRADIDLLALSVLLRAQQSGVRDPETFLALASLQSMTGATADAIENAVWVMEQSAVPKERRAAAAMIAGECYAQSGQMAEAVRMMRSAVEWAPELEDHSIALAALYRTNQEYAKAVTVLDQARRRGLHSADLLLALASNLLSSGDAAAAVNILSDFITRFPDRHEAYGLLGQAHRSSGDFASAAKILRRLAATNPQYPMIHVSLAQTLLEAGSDRSEEALAVLEEAEQVSAADPEIYWLRGKIFMRAGRHRDAAEALTRAVHLQPDSPTYRYQLGLTYRRLGKTDLAEEQFEKMRHLNR